MRKDIKNVNLTIFTDYLKQEDFKDLLYTSYSVDKCIIGANEITKNQKEHYHCYVSLSRKVNFEGFKKTFPSVHIEQVFGSVKQNYDYCCKCGEPFYISFDINNYLQKEELKDTIERALINDIFVEELPIKVIILKYPKYAIYNIRSIKDLIDIRDSEKK